MMVFRWELWSGMMSISDLYYIFSYFLDLQCIYIYIRVDKFHGGTFQAFKVEIDLFPAYGSMTWQDTKEILKCLNEATGRSVIEWFATFAIILSLDLTYHKYTCRYSMNIENNIMQHQQRCVYRHDINITHTTHKSDTIHTTICICTDTKWII